LTGLNPVKFGKDGDSGLQFSATALYWFGLVEGQKRGQAKRYDGREYGILSGGGQAD